MRQPAAKRFCITLTLMCLNGAPVHACTASNQLADLAVGYDTLLQAQDPDDWQTRSARLSDTLAATNAADLGRDLDGEGAPADISRIARLLADAISLLNSPHSDRDHHAARAQENLTYIDRLLTATGCKDARTSAYGSETPSGEPADKTANTADALQNSATTLLAGLLSLALLAGGSAYALRHKGLPKRRTKRLTRYTSAIPVLVTVENGSPEFADTADISIGGVRLSWTSAPPPGTAITVDFGEIECPARISWSNAYFAGARFNTRLSDDDLTRIRNRNNNP